MHPPAAGVYVGHGDAVEPGAGARAVPGALSPSSSCQPALAMACCPSEPSFLTQTMGKMPSVFSDSWQGEGSKGGHEQFQKRTMTSAQKRDERGWTGSSASQGVRAGEPWNSPVRLQGGILARGGGENSRPLWKSLSFHMATKQSWVAKQIQES